MISYAQNFEDVMLWRALKHVEKGFYIDLGAQDPVIDSVSLAFHELGWEGVHVEPIPHYAQMLREQRPGDMVIAAAVGDAADMLTFCEIPDTGISTADPQIAQQHRERGFEIHEITVPCVRLSSIFKACGKRDIHWMKIDVEGFEQSALASWGKATARPWVVVVESTLPLTQIESHQQWEALLLRRGYTSVYFDGLNRYYVSKAHGELKQAFYAPPNVFDDFSVNGTASTALHRHLKNRHAAELKEVTAQVHHAANEIAGLKETLSSRETVLAGMEREHMAQLEARSAEVMRTSALLISAKDDLAVVLQSAQQEALAAALALAAREREFSANFFASEQTHRTEISTMQAEVLRTSALLIAAKDDFSGVLEAAHQETLKSTQAQVTREREFSTQTASHESAHRTEILSLQSEVLRTNALLLAAKDEFAALVLAAQQEAIKAEKSLFASEQRSLNGANYLAAREREFGEKLLAQADEFLRFQREAEQEKSALKLEIDSTLEKLGADNERIILLENEKARIEQELAKHFVDEGETAAQLQQMLYIVRQEHAVMKNTLSWRLTSPFRAISQYFGRAPDIGNALAETKDRSIPHLTSAPEIATPAQQTNIDSRNLQKELMSSTDTRPYAPSVTSGATNLAELLRLERDNFIESAYLTLLKRPADSSGGAFYLDQLLKGVAKIQILDEIGLSDEAQRSGILNYEELLSLDGEQFIECAYYRLLKRMPDPAGGKFYLDQLLKGVAKIQILDELSSSDEGKNTGVALPDLQEAVAQFRRANRPFRGFFLRQPSGAEGNSALERRTRAIEQKISLLASRNDTLFKRIDHGFIDLQNLIIQQEQHRLSSAPLSKNASQRTEQESELVTASSSSAVRFMASHDKSVQSVKKTSTSSALNIAPLQLHRKTIYYFVDHTILCPVNTGMQRVVRRLGRSLSESADSIHFVKWDAALQALVLIDRNELDHLSKWHGPSLASEELRNYPQADDAPVRVEPQKSDRMQWLIVPEVTHVTYQATPVTLEIISAANRMGLKTAFVYYDAIPLRLAEYKDAAAKHEMYMQHLLLADLIVPISFRSAVELTQFFKIHQVSRINTPRIQALPLPGESQLSERIFEPVTVANDEKFILCVGSIEPRKNQIMLVNAYEKFCAANPDTKWKLILAGHLRGDVAAEINAAISRNSRISHVQSISDAELDRLYRNCAFTVFPSVEEGFGLPILESLWYSKPCVCANFGAMAEVAEEGGCYMVNTHERSELENAIFELTQNSDLLQRLAEEATKRPIDTWGDYSQNFMSLIDQESDLQREVDYVFYWVDNTCVNVENSGIQRVVRQLARALISIGIKLIPFKWDSVSSRPYPPSHAELEHLSGWNGPSPDSWTAWVEPSEFAEKSWMLIPELTHGTLANVKKYSSDAGLRCGAIFYDAIPWKMGDVFPAAFGENHRRYMEDLNLFDKVFPISNFSRVDLIGFFLSIQARTPSLEHRIQTYVLPSEFIDVPRVTSIEPRTNSVIKILSVISMEPRKNPLGLLEAFAQASTKAKSKIELTLVGRRIAAFSDLSMKVDDRISRMPNVKWERDVDDLRLQTLYAQSDFTVFPSIEEGFGLPILESLWYARPCICHNEGAMMEVAEGGGCVTIDVTDTQAFSNAIVWLADDPAQRFSLASAAILRPIKSWSDYAEEIALNIATDRHFSLKTPSHTVSDEKRMYGELINLDRRPLLSICISTFNRAKWLSVGLRNLERLLPNPNSDVEIFVCDNTSTDNTTDVVQPFLSRDDFRYLRNEKNVGMLGNLRVTAHHARGRFIWILGDDDLVLPGAIEKILSIIRVNPDLALIYLNYSYTRETDASAVKDLDQFLSQATTLIDSSQDILAPVKQIASNNENLFTAIYCQVFRRDHALRAYSQNTDGRPFSTMRTSIPTTYYVLNFMMEELAYWVGTPQIVINFNVSWMNYAALQILERVPEAQDLAERMGASPTGLDRWRENLLPGFAHYFTEMFNNDTHLNAEFFSPIRVVSRMKHLAAFGEQLPALRAVYESAHRSGHPAATMNPDLVFSVSTPDPAVEKSAVHAQS